MSTTRATYKERRTAARSENRNRELVLLLLCSAAVGAGLYLASQAKLAETAAFQTQIGTGELLLLTPSTTPEAIASHLAAHGQQDNGDFIAGHIVHAVKATQGLPNLGAVAKIRVNEREVGQAAKPDDYQARLDTARKRREVDEAKLSWWGKLRRGTVPAFVSVPLLTRTEFTAMKQSLAIRTPQQWKRSFLIWLLAFYAAFYTIHVFWRVRKFRGDQIIFPLIHLLSGIGLALMIGLRDPLRDTLTFVNFTQGIILGCIAVALFSIPNYELRASRYAYIWLALGVLLAAMLAVAGTGPGSDARVNLLGVQPVEAIRILMVLFLAGYFGNNWDALRQLKPGEGKLAQVFSAFRLGRPDYALPVFAGVVVSLALFFILHDLGPALVMGTLFLLMFGLAVRTFRLALAGLVVLILGVAFGYWISVPQTVVERVNMWRSVWDNSVPGGDQVAHSLWAFASGALSGTGLGLGSPEDIPAGHTDLIVAVLGEQLGFIGIAALFAIYALLLWRCARIALRAQGPYSFFLVAGLTLITGLQLLLISAGILGLLPLSGVVSPFLSFGRSSMTANFAVCGMILAISSRPGTSQEPSFGVPVRRIAYGFATAFAIIVAYAGYQQIFRADQTLIRGSLVAPDEEGRRDYHYNPRITRAARELRRGDIYDRNGLVLATSDWSKVEASKPKYEALGVKLDETSYKFDRRHYPLGAPMFYLLGDLRTRLKRGASNTSFEELDSRGRLQGYDDGVVVEDYPDPRDATHQRKLRRLKYDYSELIPLLRHRFDSGNEEVKELRERVRDVKMTIDARLQMRAAQILEKNLKAQGKENGAIAILDAQTGDLLASVSYPWPSASQLYPLRGLGQLPVPEESLIDRVRYGLYPPGSSFKIVTAMAALRVNPAFASEDFECIRLPDGRAGNYVRSKTRPIRDDVQDRNPHGHVDLMKGIIVSCNAYFAQLGTLRVGAKALFQTAQDLGIRTAEPNTADKLNESLPQSSYGQGQVRASPFQMARVAATIADGGMMPFGRWVLDDSNSRTKEPQRVLAADSATTIATAMRGVVTTGTGTRALHSVVPIAGKTGTAEVASNPSHAWFIGYAPYGQSSGHKIAFAILVENGKYGGTASAPMAVDLVAAASEFGYFAETAK